MSATNIDVRARVPFDTEHAKGPASEDAQIQSLARGIEVLRAFGPDTDGMTIADVARAAGLTRAGARRILLTFENLGYVRSDGRYYYLTARVLELAQGISGRRVWQITQPVLNTVAKTLNETVSAGVLDGHEAVYTVRVRSARALHVDLRVGARLPAYCSSIGRVLLAALPPGALHKYFKSVVLIKYTKFTEIEPAVLRKRLDEVRAQGWCYVREEVEEGVSGAAVPLIDPSGRTVGALTVGTSPDRTSVQTVKTKIVPALREAAATIKAELRKI